MTDEHLSLDELKEFAHNVGGKDEESAYFQAALTIVASLYVGPSFGRIKMLTGLPEESLAVFEERLVEAGIWKDGQVFLYMDDEDDDSDEFVAAVVLASAMAAGLLECGKE